MYRCEIGKRGMGPLSDRGCTPKIKWLSSVIPENKRPRLFCQKGSQLHIESYGVMKLTNLVDRNYNYILNLSDICSSVQIQEEFQRNYSHKQLLYMKNMNML